MALSAQSKRSRISVVIALFLIACLVRLLMVMVALKNPQYRPDTQLASQADMTCYTALAVIACALATLYYPLWYKAIMLLSENLSIAFTLL